jgi:hypothetical protein
MRSLDISLDKKLVLPMIASPPNTIVSKAHASLTKDLSSANASLFSPAVRRCLAYKFSLICLKAMQSRNTATKSREQTLVPNQVNGAIGSTAYRYRDMNGWRDMVARERKRESGNLAHLSKAEQRLNILTVRWRPAQSPAARLLHLNDNARLNTFANYICKTKQTPRRMSEEIQILQ